MNQEDLFYRTALRLQMEDFKNGKQKMTIGDAEFIYQFGIATIFKNGKVEFINE